jgi:branched-chain amino acid transport system substrate-binding protein
MGWSWIAPLLLLLAAPALAGEAPAIKIGLVVPTAGETGRVGESMRQAAEMALAEKGAGLDRPLDLIVREEPLDPRQAVTVAERLVRDDVWGVVGHFYSSTSIPASGVYAELAIPQITPTATHPRLTAQGFDTVFRLAGRDDQQAQTAAEFMLGRLRVRRVVIVHDQTDYGRTVTQGLLRALERRGRRVSAVEEIAQGDRDFGALLRRLGSVRPDALYFAGVFREAGYLLRQLRQAGMSPAFVSDDAALDPEFVTIAGESAATGAYLTFWPDPRRLPSAQDVIRRFEERHGSLGPYVLHTYDAVGVLVQGIQAARPRSSAPEELRKVARAIRGTEYRGALGRLRWDRHGDLAESPYVIYATRRGGSLHGWFEPVAGIGPPAGAAATRPATR